MQDLMKISKIKNTDNSDSQRPRILLCCPSAFDPLGHPEMAFSILEYLSSFGNNSKLAAIGANLGSQYSSEEDLIEIHPTRFEGFNSLSESRKLPKFIRYVLRLYTMVKFYVAISKTSSFDEAALLVDLEHEPISYGIASLLIPRIRAKKLIAVIHSFPSSKDRSIRKLYKQTTLLLLKRAQKRGVFIGLMTSQSMDHARMAGFNMQYLFMVGWGFNETKLDVGNIGHLANDISFLNEADRSITYLLVFGVMRFGKNIPELIRHFKKIRQSGFHLIIAGKNLDYNMSMLRDLAADSESTCKITIIDRYLTQEEVDFLSSKCSTHILCHAEGFNAASGPLLNAVKHNKSILSFSPGHISSTVQSLKIGLVSDLTKPEATEKALSALKNYSYNKDELDFYTWRSITARINLAIIQLLKSPQDA